MTSGNNIYNNLESCLNLSKLYYQGSTAVKSGVPLITYINEGIKILEGISANEKTKAAFAIYPIFQADVDLQDNLRIIKWLDPYILMLVMEYRNKANAFLCTPENDNKHLKDMPSLPLIEVAHMLYADKTQNQKEFRERKHPLDDRSEELDRYLNLWMTHLLKNI